MPQREQIGANRVSEANLLPHLRRQKSYTVLGISQNQQLSPELFQIECSADISQYSLVGLDAEGLAVPADSSLGISAVGMSLESGLAGEMILVIRQGEISFANDFGGVPLFLGNGGGIVEPPLPEEPDMVIQGVGVRLDGGRIFLFIGDSYLVE